MSFTSIAAMTYARQLFPRYVSLVTKWLTSIHAANLLHLLHILRARTHTRTHTTHVPICTNFIFPLMFRALQHEFSNAHDRFSYPHPCNSCHCTILCMIKASKRRVHEKRSFHAIVFSSLSFSKTISRGKSEENCLRSLETIETISPMPCVASTHAWLLESLKEIAHRAASPVNSTDD